jgi:hypothetical protein
MDPLDPSLSSAKRKLHRGVQHVATLREETEAFEHSNALKPHVERKRRSATEVEHIVYAVQAERLPLHWPFLAGEAIQNLRAALDHSVWAHSHRRNSMFPIFSDPCEFQVNGRPRIESVPKPVRELIEKAQPYNTFPSMPSRDWLARLSRLANADKHRTLTTLACFVEFPYIGYTAEEAELEWREHPPLNRPLHDGAEVTRFVVRSKTKAAAKADPRFTYKVGIAPQPNAIPLPLAETLTSIAKRVFEVVTEVESGQPISPFAQYPIY